MCRNVMLQLAQIKSYLKVACCLVARSICRYNCNIFKTSNRNGCSLRNEMNSHISGCIWCINTSPSIVEVDGITLLTVYQLDNVALGAAQQRRRIIWGNRYITCVHIYMKRVYNYVQIKFRECLLPLVHNLLFSDQFAKNTKIKIHMVGG